LHSYKTIFKIKCAEHTNKLGGNKNENQNNRLVSRLAYDEPFDPELTVEGLSRVVSRSHIRYNLHILHSQIKIRRPIVLLRPARTAIRVSLVVVAVLFWLDNIGLKVSTLLAGLGVGGLAVALAAQDTLKNLLGSIMILLDKPYRVGQRIFVKGHDGVVEEIGLRSTRMRLLTGHQTTIPNDEMAKIDIENIGQRPHIRRLANIGITYDTPPEKIEKAVELILKILDNHEGMDPEFPPRAYFSEYNSYSLNILVLYWYHPADYWGYMKFSQWVNLQIAREFQKEGIKFAFPTSTTYLSQDDSQPLYIDLGGNLSMEEKS
jgi:MscS family membrane protein